MRGPHFNMASECFYTTSLPSVDNGIHNKLTSLIKLGTDEQVLDHSTGWHNNAFQYSYIGIQNYVFTLMSKQTQKTMNPRAKL